MITVSAVSVTPGTVFVVCIFSNATSNESELVVATNAVVGRSYVCCTRRSTTVPATGDGVGRYAIWVMFVYVHRLYVCVLWTYIMLSEKTASSP